MPWQEFLPWMVIASIVMFVGSLVLVPLLIVRMPSDYFTRAPGKGSWRAAHPILRWSILILKNLAGTLFLIVGLIMLFTPGQGILFMLAGVTLLDLPGKQKVEIAILRRPIVRGTIDAIRHKAGREPLDFPNGAE